MQIQIAVAGGTCLGTIYHNGRALVMWVDDVKVDPERRGQDIGTALMLRAVGIAREENVDCIELVVNADNEAAKGLYRKVGFERTAKEHHRLILRRFE